MVEHLYHASPRQMPWSQPLPSSELPHSNEWCLQLLRTQLTRSRPSAVPLTVASRTLECNNLPLNSRGTLGEAISSNTSLIIRRISHAKVALRPPVFLVDRPQGVTNSSNHPSSLTAMQGALVVTNAASRASISSNNSCLLRQLQLVSSLNRMPQIRLKPQQQAEASTLLASPTRCKLCKAHRLHRRSTTSR